MLAIKLFSNNCELLEKYLNKKSKKGYILQSITPFILFPPLEFTVFNFKKENLLNRVYRVDFRKLTNNDRADYYQLFKEDGWSSINNPQSEDIHIFYTDSSDTANIYSDEDSLRERNIRNAKSQFIKAICLVAFFAALYVFFPINIQTKNGILGFLSSYFYIIVAVVILIISTTRYFRNRK